MTGAAIMIVEILGAKMLSPYVGLSHFVWTAQIAITLVALACGYYAGGLTSISTLGSLAGTMLIGYFLIPLFPNSITMYATALVLMLVCAGYFTFHRRKLAPALVLVLTVGAGFGLRNHLGLKGQYESFTEAFRGNSHFGRLQVVDFRDGSIR